MPVDDAFRLRPDARSTSSDACAVVATIGTTGATAVDPVPAIADALRGGRAPGSTSTPRTPGSAAVCPELRHHFAGWERADSIGVNPHKWLASPMDCSALWTRRPDDFRRAFSLVPEFLRSPDDAVNLSEVSIPLGRRFRALKLWAVLRCYGRAGLQERIREHVRLAELFEGWVRARAGLGGRRAAALLARLLPPRGHGRGERAAARAGQRLGRGLPLAHAARDRYVLRLAIGNFRTTEDDVRLAWDVLRREAS